LNQIILSTVVDFVQEQDHKITDSTVTRIEHLKQYFPGLYHSKVADQLSEIRSLQLVMLDAQESIFR